MSKVHSHYENLKVARDAPLEVIRAAYRSLTQKYHPDRNPGDSEAARIMQRINAAYEVLSDPDKRREHDAWIAAEEANEAQSESSPDSTADHGFAESEGQQQQSSPSGSPPHEPGQDSDGVPKPQGIDQSAVPAKDHSFYYDILPAAAVSTFLKNIILLGFSGSPETTSLVAGISHPITHIFLALKRSETCCNSIS